jgi:hypothetical protein
MTFVIAKPWSKRTDRSASCCRTLASASLRLRAVAAERQSRLVAGDDRFVRAGNEQRGPALAAGTNDVDALTRAGMDLKKATPTTIAEFIAKWQIVRSKLSLATTDSTLWPR